MKRTAWALAALAAAWVAGLSSDACAQADPLVTASHPDFAFGEPAGEGALLGFSGVSNFTYLIPARVKFWAPYLPRPYDPKIAEWSDLTGALGGAFIQFGLGYVFEAGYLQVGGVTNPGVTALHEVAVEAESLFLTSGITALIKNLTGRCRPRAYNTVGKDRKCKETDAFPSGHTSAIAAFSGARLVNLAYTPANDGFGLRAGALVVSEAAMSITGLLRILSGAHSWEDVVVGAVIGHATGVTVGLLHPSVALRNGEPVEEAQHALAPQRAPMIFSWGGVF